MNGWRDRIQILEGVSLPSLGISDDLVNFSEGHFENIAAQKAGGLKSYKSH